MNNIYCASKFSEDDVYGRDIFLTAAATLTYGRNVTQLFRPHSRLTAHSTRVDRVFEPYYVPRPPYSLLKRRKDRLWETDRFAARLVI